MHAASREALNQAFGYVDRVANSSDNAVAVAAQTGTELFDIVDALDVDRGLRVAAADTAAPADARAGLMKTVFGGKVSETALGVLCDIVKLNWSNPREMRTGLVEVGRRFLFRSAQEQGQLKQVEGELFRLSRILEDEPELTHLLSDRTQPASRKRELFAKVLYGKVTAVTEALALQAVGRPEKNPIDDLASLVDSAAEVSGRSVAHVVAASELNSTQEQALADKLGRIYGRAMNVHTEVDTSLLGGVLIRVGDEVIDGSTKGKIERMRRAFA